MTTILLVDDEPAVLRALERALRAAFGDELAVAFETDPLAALAQLRAQTFDIVVSDLRMPLLDGVELLTLARAVQPRCVRMLLTGGADFATAQRAIQDAGVFRYLCKPWETRELVAHVRAAMAQATSEPGQPAQAPCVPAVPPA